MELVNKIPHVTSVLDTPVGIFYKVQNIYHNYMFASNSIEMLEERDQIISTCLRSNGEMLLAMINSKIKGFTILNDNGEIQYKNNVGSITNLQRDYLIESGKDPDFTRIVSLDNYKTIYEFKFRSGFHYTYNNYCIGFDFYDNRNIICLDINTGEIKWKYNTESQRELSSEIDGINIYYLPAKILGVNQNTLIILLQYGLIIGIDIKTGDYKFEYLYPDIGPKTFEIFSMGHNHHNRFMQLDSVDQKLFGLNAFFYFEIDLQKSKDNFIMYDISESQVMYNVAPSGSGLSNWPTNVNLLYYAHSDKSKYINNIGVFDMANKVITNALSVNVKEIEKSNSELKYIHPVVNSMNFVNNLLFIHVGRHEYGELYIYRPN